jgi:pectin methylesterase-like acyl-CoA thioesterase
MAALIVAFVPGGGGAGASAEGAIVHVIRVPQDAASPQAAVAAATAGDLILLDRGTYAGGVTVPPAAGGITIRGVDRNAVAFDGQDRAITAVEIHADDVTLENLTVRNYTGTAIYWDEVRGFAGRYLTVSNVGAYGV